MGDPRAMLWSVWIQRWYACNLPIPLWFLKSQPCCGKWKGQPTEMEMPGSYLMSDSILPNTLSAGLLKDTAAVQHDLVLGTEAAFWGVVPTGASVPVTVPRAATLTVVIHQGRWARQSCRQRIRSFSMAYTSQKQKKHRQFRVAKHPANFSEQTRLVSPSVHSLHLPLYWNPCFGMRPLRRTNTKPPLRLCAVTWLSSDQLAKRGRKAPANYFTLERQLFLLPVVPVGPCTSYQELHLQPWEDDHDQHQWCHLPLII